MLKTCLKPGFRQVLSRQKVGNLVSDKIDLSRHVEIDLAASFRQKKSESWSPTSFEQKKSPRPGLRLFFDKKSRRPCLRLVCDLVSDKSYDKIDLMEFELQSIFSVPQPCVCVCVCVDGTSVTFTIAGTVVGTLLLTTFVIIVVMIVQRRRNDDRHRRDVELQIRDDLFRNVGGGLVGRPQQRRHEDDHSPRNETG